MLRRQIVVGTQDRFGGRGRLRFGTSSWKTEDSEAPLHNEAFAKQRLKASRATTPIAYLTEADHVAECNVAACPRT